jgi:hypothetical protein
LPRLSGHEEYRHVQLIVTSRHDEFPDRAHRVELGGVEEATAQE